MLLIVLFRLIRVNVKVFPVPEPAITTSIEDGFFLAFIKVLE
jgi:hypothetical protein